jgi:hypothetical protein
MVIYKAYNPDVEVNKRTISSVINALPVGVNIRREILRKNGIDLTSDIEWFNQQLWLNCFSDIEEILGETILFVIGQAIPNSAYFPEIDSLKDALEKLDIAYHLNHRLNGKVMYDRSTGKFLEGIGHYSLKEYDEEQHYAVMVCENPYPSRFDLGIITRLARKYSPTSEAKVYLDLTKETRLNGGSSCTYIIEF